MLSVAVRFSIAFGLCCGVLAGALAGGCAVTSIDLTRLGSADSQTPARYDDRAFATVVRENVKDGLVDYRHLAAHRDSLDGYAALIAAVGPTSTPGLFPTRDDRTSYYINTYNAGILLAVLHAGVPETIHTLRVGSVDHRFRLAVDGSQLPIGELRKMAIASSGDDMRVVLALCDGAVGSPSLHDQPIRGRGLDETLRLLARRAMDNHRIVSVDHEQQRLLLSVDLIRQRDAFIAYHRKQTGAGQATMLNVALHFASGVRRQWLSTAVGYTEGLIPFDRRLNRWPPQRD